MFVWINYKEEDTFESSWLRLLSVTVKSSSDHLVFRRCVLFILGCQTSVTLWKDAAYPGMPDFCYIVEGFDTQFVSSNILHTSCYAGAEENRTVNVLRSVEVIACYCS